IRRGRRAASPPRRRSARAGGGRAGRGAARDPDLALHGSAVGGGEAAGLERAGENAGGENLDPRGSGEIAPHHAANLNRGGMDIGVDLGALADEDLAGDVDLPLELAEDLEVPLAAHFPAQDQARGDRGHAGEIARRRDGPALGLAVAGGALARGKKSAPSAWAGTARYQSPIRIPYDEMRMISGPASLICSVSFHSSRTRPMRSAPVLP